MTLRLDPQHPTMCLECGWPAVAHEDEARGLDVVRPCPQMWKRFRSQVSVIGMVTYPILVGWLAWCIVEGMIVTGWRRLRRA